MIVTFSPRLFIVTVIALGSLTACQTEPEKTAASPQVAASVPIQREVTGLDTFTGRFQARESVDVRPRVTGYIDRVAFGDGQIVKKGDLLFVIDPRPYQATVTEAEGRLADAHSQLDLRQLEYARGAKLVTTGAIAQSQYDQRQQAQQASQAAVTTAEGALARARLDLAFTEVRAPMAGRVSRHFVSVGNLVTENSTLLTTIVSVDPIDIYFDIDEESYLRYGDLVQTGQRDSVGDLGGSVAISLPGDRIPSRAGILDFVDNRLDQSTGTLRLRAHVPNPNGSLNPGQFGTVQIVGEASHPALLVPDSAVISDPSGKSLAIVDQDHRVAVRSVALGRLYGPDREIRSGLKPDEQVIASGLQRVTVGEKVTVSSKFTKNTNQAAAEPIR